MKNGGRRLLDLIKILGALNSLSTRQHFVPDIIAHVRYSTRLHKTFERCLVNELHETEPQRSLFMKRGPFEPSVFKLENMDLAELRQAWVEIFSQPVPKVSATILRLALAFEFQAMEFGGLSRSTIARMDMLVRSGRVNLPLQPGMRLIREWEGKLHVITVDDAGHIIWEGQRRRSLSAVARAITGTRWSGPAFFGLIQRSSAA